jgi:hypothetical protein
VTFHGYRGLALDVLTRKIDFIELMQFCSSDGPLALEHYYHFLDLGFPITALGGSDFPWCGRSPRFGLEQIGPQIGDARFYTHVGNPFSFEKWLKGIKAGHTFVSTGPMLELRVNNLLPGASLDVKRGARVRITAQAQGHPGQIPLRRLQIIGHGKVLAEVAPGSAGQSAGGLTIDREIEVPHGIWLAARTDAGPGQMAHTTPVYVTVERGGFHDPAGLAQRVDKTRGYLQEIRELLRPPASVADVNRQSLRTTPPPWRYPATVVKLERRIAEAEKVLEEILARR